MQLAVPVAPAQHFERHPFKGMALANDRYVVGKIIEVVGSLSSSPSIQSRTTRCSNRWRVALWMARCFG
jgi:hypothetical protein